MKKKKNAHALGFPDYPDHPDLREKTDIRVSLDPLGWKVLKDRPDPKEKLEIRNSGDLEEDLLIQN
jgi:hypothetical protein